MLTLCDKALSSGMIIDTIVGAEMTQPRHTFLSGTAHPLVLGDAKVTESWPSLILQPCPKPVLGQHRTFDTNDGYENAQHLLDPVMMQ